MTTPATYRISIHGHLDARWAHYFSSATVDMAYNEKQEPITMLTDHFADQSALMGMLRYLNGLGLYLIGVEQINPEEHHA